METVPVMAGQRPRTTSETVQKVLPKHEHPEEIKRPTWGFTWEFTLICIGFSVGLGNVWRFPYLCYKSGGGAFLVPYLTLMTCVGVPMLFMEYGLGQYYGVGGLQIFAKFCPLFKGMGIALGILNSLVTIYYNIIIGTSIFYFVNSFTSPLPWTTCDNSWNSPDCESFVGRVNATAAMTVSDVSKEYSSVITDMVMMMPVRQGRRAVSSSEEFYYRGLLDERPEHSVTNLGSIRWKYFGCVAVAWFACFLFLLKGIKTSGKVAMVSATFPYIMLTVLLIRGVTLPGALEGIKYLFIPTWSKILEPNIWFAAAQQLFFANNLGWGGMVSMASYNPFHYPVMRDAIAINAVNLFTSLYAGFAVFSIIGFMAHETGKQVQDVIASGPGLVFIVYPRAISLMNFAPFLSVLFFFMIFLLGIDSEMVSVETIVSGLCDYFPLLHRHQIITLGVVCFGSFCISIPMMTQGGMYVFQIMDNYSAGVNLFIFAFIQLIVIHWIFGTTKFSLNVQRMISYMPALPFRICWKVISPLFILFVFIFRLVKYQRITYGLYVFPLWADLLGWGISLGSIVPIIVLFVMAYYSTDGRTAAEKFRIASKPIYGLDHNEALVAIIDVSLCTTSSEPAGLTGLQDALDCLSMILNRKLFTEARDKVALILLGTPNSPDDECTAKDKQTSVPHVLLVSSMDYISGDLVELVHNSVLPNEEKVGDLGDAMLLAIDHINTTMREARGFTRNRIILFSETSVPFANEKYEKIVSEMLKQSISLDVIGPANGGNIADEILSRASRRNISEHGDEASLKMILRRVHGEILTIRKTIPALHYFDKDGSRSVAWRCHLEINETLSIAACCYTGVRQPYTTRFSGLIESIQPAEPEPEQEPKPEPVEIKETEDADDKDDNNHNASGRVNVPFSADDKDMDSLTSHCFKTLGFTNCDNLRRDAFISDSPLLVFADKAEETASIAFSVLVNAMSETNNALIVRRIFTDQSQPVIGCLVAHATPNCECLIFNELPFPDDCRQFTYLSLCRPTPGSFKGRKRESISPSAEELNVIAELAQNMNVESSLKNRDSTVFADVKRNLLLNQYVRRLRQCLEKPSFNPDRPLPGMLAVFNSYAGLPVWSVTPANATEADDLRSGRFAAFFQLRTKQNKNQNAITRISQYGRYSDVIHRV